MKPYQQILNSPGESTLPPIKALKAPLVPKITCQDAEADHFCIDSTHLTRRSRVAFQPLAGTRRSRVVFRLLAGTRRSRVVFTLIAGARCSRVVFRLLAGTRRSRVAFALLGAGIAKL